MIAVMMLLISFAPDDTTATIPPPELHTHPLAVLAQLQGVWRAADGRQVEFHGDRITFTSSDGLSGFTARVVVRRDVLLIDGMAKPFAVDGRRLRIGGTWLLRTG